MARVGLSPSRSASAARLSATAAAPGLDELTAKVMDWIGFITNKMQCGGILRLNQFAIQLRVKALYL